MERYKQGEVFYPSYQEPVTILTGCAWGIRRFSDGFWYDFNDSTYKNSGWTTKHQALSADDLGLWTLDAGYTLPASDATYVVQWKLTDAGTTYYKQGPLIVVALIGADMLAISSSTAAADNLEASAETMVIGAAEAGTLSTTQMSTNLTEVTDSHYNNRIIIWTSGVLLGQITPRITGYVGVNGVLTFTAVTEAPSAGDTFIIV